MNGPVINKLKKYRIGIYLIVIALYPKKNAALSGFEHQPFTYEGSATYTCSGS